MSQEADTSQEVGQVPVEDTAIATETPLEELLESLKTVQDDAGQICELVSEERSFVSACLESLLKIMRPLKATIPISPSVVVQDSSSLARANIDSEGHFIILYKDGRMELKNLEEETNRDLLIRVIRDVVPKLTQLTTSYRQKVENRISFLSAVTKELQKISKAFSAICAK